MRTVQRFNRTKRLIDITLIGLSSPVTTPLGLIVAAYVRVRLGGPVLFRQERIGLNGTRFDVVKFRSMTNERDQDHELLPDVNRLSPGGRFLRKLSLDEIPQLWNVLKGDMAIVGPRPLYPSYLPYYSEDETRRHNVRPGITGLAQINGRNALGWDARLRLDVEYVERREIRADGQIYAQTLRQVMTGRDVAVLASESGEPLDVERSYPRTAQLAVRALRSADLATRVEWMNHPSTRDFMRIPQDLTLATTQEWFGRTQPDTSRRDFVVFERRTGDLVAMAGLKTIAQQQHEFYVFVDPARHGEGLGTSTTEMVVEWAREAGTTGAIVLQVSSQNLAALRIYESLGFSQVALEGERHTMQLQLEQLRSA